MIPSYCSPVPATFLAPIGIGLALFGKVFHIRPDLTLNDIIVSEMVSVYYTGKQERFSLY
jgi:hypothetical protein